MDGLLPKQPLVRESFQDWRGLTERRVLGHNAQQKRLITTKALALLHQ
jgi:hypothetical protein